MEIWKVIASFFLAKLALDMVRFVWRLIRLFGLPKLGLKKNLKKYGQYAVVTGSTDGIGKAVAEELAKRGLDLVLISRSKEKLETVAEEIKGKSEVDIKTIAYDFSKTDEYDDIAEKIKDLDVGILVNNVGMSYDHPSFYLEVEQKDFDKMVSVNMISVLKMSEMVLKGMVERNRGLLVHVASSSALFPHPFLSVYSASKAFVDFFGRASGLEYKMNHIDSQVLVPSLVSSNLSKVRPSLMAPSCRTFARSAVDVMGLTDRTTGYWFHEILCTFLDNLPYGIKTGIIFNHMGGVRKRWIRKQERMKKE